jgi:hypothetical protein
MNMLITLLAGTDGLGAGFANLHISLEWLALNNTENQR